MEQQTSTISNGVMQSIMKIVNSSDEYSILIKSASESLKNEAK